MSNTFVNVNNELHLKSNRHALSERRGCVCFQTGLGKSDDQTNVKAVAAPERWQKPSGVSDHTCLVSPRLLLLKLDESRGYLLQVETGGMPDVLRYISARDETGDPRANFHA